MEKEKYLGPIVDTHSHFMPATDDGSESMEMTMEMLRMAEKEGVTDLFFTSHGDFVCERIDEYHRTFNKVKEEAKEQGIRINLYEGCEIFSELTTWEFEGDNDEMKPIIRALQEGVYPAYNGTKYALIEFDIGIQPPEALYMVKRIQSGGYHIVLAHVERYPFLVQSDFVKTLVREECLVQINVGSLQDETIGIFKNGARKLLKDGLVSFIGSDAHGIEKRPPRLQSGVQYIWEHCDEEYAKDVIYRNAYKYLLSQGK